MLVQGALHGLEPLVEALPERALALVKLFILIVASLIGTAIIEAADCHLVYQAFSHQVLLSLRDLARAAGALPLAGSAGFAKGVPAGVKPHGTSHEGLAGGAVQIPGIAFVYEFIIATVLSRLLLGGLGLHASSASRFSHNSQIYFKQASQALMKLIIMKKVIA